MAHLNNNDFYRASSIIRRNCSGAITHCVGQNAKLDKLLESYKSLTVKQLGL
jgi:hypothetical protein